MNFSGHRLAHRQRVQGRPLCWAWPFSQAVLPLSCGSYDRRSVPVVCQSFESVDAFALPRAFRVV